jgi:starch-binding outer membrane protein, SusD/RagB family
MKNSKKIVVSFISMMALVSCQDQLTVKTNTPLATQINSEGNIISEGLGIYATGFRGLKYGGYQGTFLGDVWALHEIMGDAIGCEAANIYINQVGMPDVLTTDAGAQIKNPATPNTQLGLLRFANVNSLADQNPVYYEWGYMYAINAQCNSILANVDGITYSNDAATKKNTLKAWAYFWKGYAYSRIGSMYYAGIISDELPKVISNNYVTKEEIIAEANANLDKATAALNAVTATVDFKTVITQLIPTVNQIGKGAIPTVDMWKRGINTLKARNILVNTRVNQMTTDQWNQILTLTNGGILPTDNVFTGRSNDAGDFMSATSGAVSLLTAVTPASSTYKISERIIQDFKPGDKRFTNNFTLATTKDKNGVDQPTLWTGDASRGTIFNTRWRLYDGGNNVAGAIVLASRTAGAGEVYLIGTYEENELMKAEAKIYLGDIAGGLASIDAVRTYQGAGLTAVAGTTTDPVVAKEELRKERRIGLLFRALSFYDARRWGVIDPVSVGGGRKGAVVVDKSKTVNTNATIDFSYLDYWDVPNNEVVYNPPPNGFVYKNPRAN